MHSNSSVTGGETLCVYPKDELLRARSEFIYRWNNLMNRNPVATLIKTYHYQYPPNIILKNCIKYPFDDDHELDMCPSFSTRKDVKLSGLIKSHVVSQELFKQANSELFTDKISEENLHRMCSLLIDRLRTSEEYLQSLNEHHCISAWYFICDNCDFISTKDVDALNHLKQTGHLTCSKYLPCYSTVENNNNNDIPYELQEPRTLSNKSGRIYGGSVGDSVVCCPTCNLIFLDKLMCAYHHHSQHSNNELLFTYGKVLVVHNLNIKQSQVCCDCQRKFCTAEAITNHWIHSTHCKSPFMFMQKSKNALNSHHYIFSVMCSFCKRTFTKTPSFEKIVCQPGMKRKHQMKTVHQSLTSWVTDFSHFCVSHAFKHICQGKSFSCDLSVRIISMSKSIEYLPPFKSVNEFASLLFCVHECKRLISYLEKYHGSCSHLLKKAKRNLKGLLTKAQSLIS
ncbi:unnamed protein product [Heterobilharzia americana]|nr:unnamed protein product [Heterobilharzia americana]